jgi:hypothetical protein
MTIKTYQLGPGTLTLGSGALEVNAQVSKCELNVKENVTDFGTKPVKVLSGEVRATVVDEFIEFSFTLDATLFQDLAASGAVAWSWEHAGTEQPFTFTPNTALGASYEGTIKPVPINVGGDVGPDATADISWRGNGMGLPTPTWAA